MFAHTHIHIKKRRNHGVWFTLDTYTWACRLPGVWLICTAQLPFINQQCQNTSNIYNSLQNSLQENTPAVVLIFLGRMIDFFFAYVQLIFKVTKYHLFFLKKKKGRPGGIIGNHNLLGIKWSLSKKEKK